MPNSSITLYSSITLNPSIVEIQSKSFRLWRQGLVGDLLFVLQYIPDKRLDYMHFHAPLSKQDTQFSHLHIKTDFNVS